MDFATKDKSGECIPVIFQYHLTKGTKVGFKFFLNSTLYSAYPNEEEILIDDGHKYRVKEVLEN